MDELQEKRQQFINQLKQISLNGKKDVAAFVDGIERIKFYKECIEKQPTLWELADGYKGFITDLGPGFLEIAENLNVCIQLAKEREIIGSESTLNARIKDFSSSLRNEKQGKMLDDIFGIEIVTGSIDSEPDRDEVEKEMMLLFCQLVFNTQKDKRYNKPNGYRAHHTTGYFSIKDVDIREWILETIQNKKTVEYKRSKSEPNYNDKKRLVPMFPGLQNAIIANPKLISLMTNAFSEMADYMSATDRSISIPDIEFHFITLRDRINSLTGSAAHSKYKGADRTEIIRKFKTGKILRGINSPIKFVGTKEGNLKLQDFYTTLSENWEFLIPYIEKRKAKGKEVSDNARTAKFDKLEAIVYPFLKKYVDFQQNVKCSDKKKDELWGILKGVIITDRIGANESLPDSFVESLSDMLR